MSRIGNNARNETGFDGGPFYRRFQHSELVTNFPYGFAIVAVPALLLYVLYVSLGFIILVGFRESRAIGLPPTGYSHFHLYSTSILSFIPGSFNSEMLQNRIIRYFLSITISLSRVH